MIANIFGGFLLLLSSICGTLLLSYAILRVTGKRKLEGGMMPLWVLFFVCGFVGLWLVGAIHFSK